MKLKAIKKIKQYKSFQEFTWQPFFNSERFHDDVNILYGENASGKSSICNILKSVSQNKSFDPKHKPEEICLQFDDGDYKFAEDSDKWDKIKNEDDILFFDREFVDKNIHLGHKRGTQQNEQEQRSGEMIIEFDEKAIDLRSAREKTKIGKDNEEKILQRFQQENSDILNSSLTNEEDRLFKKYKDESKEKVTEIKSQLASGKKATEKKLETDQTSQKKVSDIQNSIKEINNEEVNIFLSDYKNYQDVFNFDLKEQVKIEAEQVLIEKLQLHKDFFETGFEIRKNHPTECPFCQSKTQEENIKKVVQAYNDIFDETYKKQLQQFESNKQNFIKELETIREEVEGFDLNSIFLELKNLDQKYKIKDIYTVDEEKKYKKPQRKKINELIIEIKKLKKPNKENIKSLFDELVKEFELIKNFFSDISKFVKSKNKIILKFKLENTDEKLQKRITENSAKINEIEQQLTFFSEKKIEIQKKKELKEKELKVLQKKFEAVETVYKNAKADYEKYCSDEVFTKPLKKIEEYFKNFNFSFKLELKTEKTRNKSEFPFAFKVLDSGGNERDLKEGLSEGELQVLSLCFFFAFLDIQKNRKSKILIFDDPITSLDNSNLSYLVDLISKEQVNFSQTFVFTHHRTFFKFLRKNFKTSKKDCLGNEYNIIRNKKEFGGSFICKSNSKGFKDQLNEFETDVYDKAKNGTAINVELKIVEYGQYLRYEVEKFIKHNLLFWHAESNFSVAINGIKENKTKIKDEDLDKINDVYKFCNWTTSHVDVGDDHGLQQLKDKIADFIAVTNF
jgi:wobble nucleotide-excising tRNase